MYDNCKYKPIYNDCQYEVIPKNQGNDFREIDLTCIPYKQLEFDFKCEEFKYDFNRVKKLSNTEWFEKEDLRNVVFDFLQEKYEEQEYLLLERNFDKDDFNNEIEKYPLRSIWLQVRSYMIKESDLDKFKQWVKDKKFMGRWMPEGISFYEGCIGEYPWGAAYRNILEDNEDERFEDNEDKLPVNLISTVNQFNNEKDAIHCTTTLANNFLFPSSKIFKEFPLVLNGQNVYFYTNEKMFIISNNDEPSIYVNKKLIDKYLQKKGLTLIWRVLGEKEVIKGNFNMDFSGSAEISETYIYENNKIIKNHYLYKVNQKK